MALLEKLKSTLTDTGAGEVQRYQCLNCGGTFQTASSPDTATCPACDTTRLREVRQ